MKTSKVTIAFLTLSALLIQTVAQSAHAASTYEPDNSLRTDPLQASKQLGGNLEVGEFTGAAIYSVPIALPAGRNGMAPSVQLTYNSQDSALDNVVGFHWSLNPFSIKRINKRGVEKLYDRNDFMANGPFGGGELIPTALDDGHHGQYGEKNERSFAKYEYQSDNSWLVTDKRGTRYIFGAMEEGRQFDPADASRTFQWMLEEILDLNDNGMIFTYFKDGNQLYPKTIRYTNHGAEEGIFEVRFLPFADGSAGTSRVDSHTSFAEGFRVDTQRLVTGIEVKTEGQLRRKFEIGYTTVDPLTKNTIGRITETGYDLNGNPTTLPATIFEYTPSVVSWGETTDYLYPGYFQTCYSECESSGATWDMNGDGLTDFETVQNGASQRYTNNGKNGFTAGTGNFINIYSPSLPTMWSKPIDFDGDNSNEIVTSSASNYDPLIHSTIQANGRPLITDTIPIAFGLPGYGMNDNGASVADLNGDGLPDILQSHSYFYSGTWSSNNTIDKATCLNTDGNSCVKTTLWEAPVIFSSASGTQQSPRQSYVQDCNTDGLADVVYTGSGGGNWINDGKGGWIPNAARCDLPPMDSLTTRSLDANGDGLMDQVLSYLTITDGGQFTTNLLNINTGNGFKTFSNQFPLTLGGFGSGNQSDGGVRIEDVNGDGLPDVLQAALAIDTSWRGGRTEAKKTFLNQGTRPYFLKTVHTSGGATITLETKNSATLRTPVDAQANPALPIHLPVLTKMTVEDGLGHVTFTDYQYEDGHFYFQNSDNREFAGFRVVTKTDTLGYKTKTYFHQDENSVADAANGEWDDHISKKGIPYRTEAYDNQGRLVRMAINKIEKTDLGNGRFFVTQKQTVTADVDPVSGNKRSTAKAFEYDDFGNLTTVTDYGEVALNSNDGSFTDIGNDLLTQTTTYTQNMADHLVGLASESKLVDQGGTQLSDQRMYYDGLALGEVVKGNATKNETWLNTTDTFLAQTTDYDTFGLPIRQTNPRGFSTTIEYDPLNLYPATVANALGHATHTVLDLGIGQALETTDANGLKTKQTYDGIGRPVTMEISDPKNPGTMVVTKTFEFDDYSLPHVSKQVAHNDDGQTVESVAYADGLGRTIETKQEASNGKWVTSETVFDEQGNVKKSIQPFFANASTFESVDGNKVGTTMIYDALGRATAVTNSLGATTTVYNGWDQTVTDPNGKAHDYQFDSRGRLTQVTEYLGAQANRTNYIYDALGNLIGLTDALGNTRAFTYDSLGHRLTQTDAAKPGQTGHVWSYQYDTNGNLTERLDANGKAVRTTYDELDRATQMDLDSQPGIDFSFQYDQGANAIGRLSAVIGQNYEKRPTYDLLGRVTLEQKKIGGKDFDFANDYDLLGGVKTLTYPDGMTVDYAYDSAHQISKVSSDGKTFADQFDFTPLGQLAQVNLGNGIVTTNTYDPDKLYRLTEKKSLLFGTARVQDFLYNYDAVGNLMKLEDESNAITSKTVDYRYDDLYRLLEARYTNTGNQQLTVSNFQYDPIGNMTFKSGLGTYVYGADNPHAVTKAGPKVFGYDSAGNMTQRDGKNYSYDEFGRILKIGNETAYQYDEAGQRILKTNLATGESMIYASDLFESELNEDTKYVFAGKQKIAKVTRKTVPAPTVDPVAQDPTDPAVTFNGTKPADLSLWLNGIEILPAGPETTWMYSANLVPGDNTFDFYTKKDADTVSRKVTVSLHYEVTAPTVEFVESPQTVVHVTLKGTKGANTAIWINGAQAVALNAETTWETIVALTSTQNTFEILAKDRLGNASASVQMGIAYVATTPTVEPFDQPVKANPLSITGTKTAGMGIWINGEEKVPANDDLNWASSLRLVKGINQFSVAARNEFGVTSNGVLLTIPYEINAPSLDPMESPTSLTLVPLTGYKRAYTSVWINGREVVPMDAEEVWVTTVRLTDLHNLFAISTKDEEGLESEAIALTLDYDPVAPATDPLPSVTSANPFTLSGTKVAGTAIWINGHEAVPADDTTVWFASVPLSEGENVIEIMAVSRFGIESESVKLSVSYTRPAYTGAFGSSTIATSGGGASDIALNTLLSKRMIERQAQEAELIAQVKDAKKNGVTDAPVATEDIVFTNQSGDRSNTPKPLWPTAKSTTNVQFKNLQIAYGNGKATLAWDKMSKEVTTFDIYRSTDPIPSISAKNTALKVASISADSKANRFADKVKKSARHTYRVVARNKAGQIVRTSLMLTPDTVFISEDAENKISFGNYTDKPFTKVYVSDHPRFDFEKTEDARALLIAPKNGFKSGARISVRFINCKIKKDGRDHCDPVDEKTLDVFVVKDDSLMARLRKMGDQLFSLLVPQAQAKGVDPEEKVEYYLSDHLGGVDVVMDEQGNVVERRDYLPFGEERVTEGTSDERHGFTGKELDSETGLYYYGARYYDPALGRFASLDPLLLGESSKSLQSALSNPQALNGYSYVLNNPVRYVDGTGQYQEDVHFDLTYFLGLVAGLEKEQARTIAFRDQFMDENPFTAPTNPGTATYNLVSGKTHFFHFQTREEAYDRLSMSIQNKSLLNFGDALHTFQDSFSHEKYIKEFLGHARDGHSPDLTYKNVAQANRMARSTFYQLRKMNLEMNGSGEKTRDEYLKETTKLWSAFKDPVNTFNQTVDKSNLNISKLGELGRKESVREIKL